MFTKQTCLGISLSRWQMEGIIHIMGLGIHVAYLLPLTYADTFAGPGVVPTIAPL